MALYVYFLHLIILCFQIWNADGARPIITRPPPKLLFPKEGVINLPCDASGDPEPSIIWYDANTKRPVLEGTKKLYGVPLYHINVAGKLVIPEPQSKKIYELYCNATNKDGSDVSHVVRTGHAFLNSMFRESPPDKDTSIGSTVMLTCEPPSGMPVPRVSWEKMSTTGKDFRQVIVNKRIQITPKDNSLVIRSVVSSDAGHYRCVATNAARSEVSQAAQLAIKPKLRFIKISRNKTAVFASDVTLKCALDVTSHPVTWFRRGNNSMPVSRTQITGMSLTIKTVQQSDAGEYVCSSGGNEGVVNLKVPLPPYFLETPNSQNVSEGDNVVLKCVCKESATFYWELPKHKYFLNTKSSENPRYRYSNRQGLIIKSVTRADQGEYKCTCHNSFGMFAATATLTVKPRLLPPIVEYGPQDQVLYIGSTATFRCEPQEIGETVVTWFRGNTTRRAVNIQKDPRLVKIQTSTLQINDIKPTDAGAYTCLVEHGALSTRWTAQLTVLSEAGDKSIIETKFDRDLLPDPPTNVRVQDMSSTSITLRWDPPPRRYKVYSYRLEMTQPSTRQGWRVVEPDWTGDMIRVPELKPKGEYSFLVRSRNSIGLGRPSQPTHYVKTRETEIDNGWVRSADTSKINQIVLGPPLLTALSFSQVKVVWNIKSRKRKALDVIGGYNIKHKEVNVKWCYNRMKQSSSVQRHCSIISANTNPQRRTIYFDKLAHLINANASHTREIITEIPIRHSSGSNSFTRATVIGNLLPFRCYEFTVEPFSVKSDLGITQGPESSTKTALTYEDLPSSAPRSVSALWLNNHNMKIKWVPPPVEHWNGLLMHYVIYVFGNDSKYRLLERVSIDKTSKILVNMKPNLDYIIHMAAQNCKGIGVRSAAFAIKSLYHQPSSSFLENPLVVVILVGGIILWIGLMVLIFYICYNNRGCSGCGWNRYSKKKIKENVELLTKPSAADDQYESSSRLPHQQPDLTVLDMRYQSQHDKLPYNCDVQTPSDKSTPYYSDLPCLDEASLHPAVTCPGDVVPYASTAILNIGSNGHYRNNILPPRGGPLHANNTACPMMPHQSVYPSYYPNSAQHQPGHFGYPNGFNNIYSDNSQLLDDYNGMGSTTVGRLAPNFRELIPPPPNDPPPAVPPYYAHTTLPSPAPLPPLPHSSDQLTRSGTSRDTSTYGSDKVPPSKQVNNGSDTASQDDLFDQYHPQMGQSLRNHSNSSGSGTNYVATNAPPTRPSYTSSSSSAVTTANRGARAASADRVTATPNTGRSGRSDSEEQLIPQQRPVNNNLPPSLNLHKDQDRVSSVSSCSTDDEQKELTTSDDDQLSSAPRTHSGNLASPDTSSYGEIAPAPQPHRPYPKSNRKQQMKQNARR